jgi:hypothetical protein
VYQALHWAKMKAGYLTRSSGEEHRPAVIEVGIEVDEGRYMRFTPRPTAVLSTPEEVSKKDSTRKNWRQLLQ